MSQTTPPTITPAPTAPQRANRTTFSGLVDAFVTWLIAAVAQFQALGTNCYNNCVDAFNSATAAASSATASAGSAAAAANSAGAAAVAAGVSAWISGTTYAVGDCRYSPSNFWTYRRKTAGSGTTDPSSDATNWALISSMTPGLQLLATLTPTAAANVDFLTVFSATYDNYLILGDGLLPSADDSLAFRFAVSGAAVSTSSYVVLGGTGSSSGAATQGVLNGACLASGAGGSFAAVIANVNSSAANKTSITSSLVQSAAGPTFLASQYNVGFSVASVVTGIRLFWASGSNFAATGKIRVYGYQNS